MVALGETVGTAECDSSGEMIGTNKLFAAAIGIAVAVLGVAASASAESASTRSAPEYRGGWLYTDRDGRG